MICSPVLLRMSTWCVKWSNVIEWTKGTRNSPSVVPSPIRLAAGHAAGPCNSSWASVAVHLPGTLVSKRKPAGG
jgi:hypothetical protein